eukprot:GEMP01054218.1.p1 GENE.GEMP01054218.1~~GEMP01054218.1.p1  ORF type:complete len:380 (+),score=78.28 GEMP01054218.1:106-1140(+)
MRKHLAAVLVSEDPSTWAELLGPSLQDAFHEGAEWPHSDDDEQIAKFVQEIIADLKIPPIFMPVSRRDQLDSVRYYQTPLVVADDSAGLELEAVPPYGYIVSANDGGTRINIGDAVVGIKDQPLVDIDAEEVEEVFGENFAPHVILHVVEKVQEQLSVGDMKVQSLPKRNRRQHKVEVEVTKKKVVSEIIPIAEDALVLRPVDVRNYEYLDHTADIIFHSWGQSRSESFEQTLVAMFSYMTELDSIEMTHEVTLEAKGHDILDLLYHFLDEFLYLFSTEYFVGRRVIVELDEENFVVRARAFGERFTLEKHPQGTEIKAITMHEMKVQTRPDKADHEVYVLVDI